MPQKHILNHEGGVSSIVKVQRLLVLLALLMVGCVPETSVVHTGIPTQNLEPFSTHTPTAFPLATFTINPSPIPTPVCTDKSGHTEEITYSGYVDTGEIPVRVYLPPCYEVMEDLYPVLYLLHGYPMDEMHWESLGVTEVVEDGVVMGRWEPFLIVMPRIPDPLNTHSDGGPGSYEEELLLGLIPAIEKAYHVLGTEYDRAIVGVSRGGVWALEIGFRNVDVFNTVAALSPALHVNNPRPAYNPFNLVLTAERLPDNIFLSAAEDEGGFRSKTEELSRLLDELDISHTYLLTDGVHEDATWKAIMEDLVKFIAASWGQSS